MGQCEFGQVLFEGSVRINGIIFVENAPNIYKPKYKNFTN